MPALTRDEALQVIATHEWQWKDDGKHIMCPTCGAQFRYTTKRRTHRKGCHWVKLTILVGFALCLTKQVD